MSQLFKRIKNIIRKLRFRIYVYFKGWWADVMGMVAGVRRRMAVSKAEQYHARTGKKVNVVDGQYNTSIITRESRKILKKKGVIKKGTTAVDVDKVSHRIIQQWGSATDQKNKNTKKNKKR